MQNLKVIESELVPVYETSTGEKVVYGTELYECLGSKRKYTDWLKGRLTECDAVEDEDYDSFSQNNEKPTGGRPKSEYIIKLDTAKEMAMLERNEKGKQVRRYFIEVEKKYKAQNISSGQLSPELSPQLQLLINMELKQKEHDAELNRLDSKIDSIKEVVALNPNDWRKDSGRIINKIAQALGGYEHIKDVREESYKLLEQRMGVALNIRLTNKKKTMSLNGVCKSKVDKLNQLDVIADDKKLIEGYIAVIKDMAIKNGIADSEVA